MPSEVRFTRSGTVDLAYQVVGDGPVDIVVMIGWVSHLEVLWELPEVRRFLERLAGMGRVVIFDKRGTGLSDRPAEVSTTDDMVPDVLAVMDAAGMERAALVGWVDAAAIALAVADRHPERVAALVLGEVIAAPSPDDEHPWTLDPSVLRALAEAIDSGAWGQGVLLPLIAPSIAGDERILGWYRKLERMAATPSMAANVLSRTTATDMRPMLGRVGVPALLLHRRDAPLIPGAAMEWMAGRLAAGRYVEVPGDEIPGYLGDVDALMDEVEEFLVGTRVGSTADRAVVTVLFSDVVGSTERVASLGDRRWNELLATHRSEARRVLARHGGREIDTAGDGFLISFPTPSAAIRCARELCDASSTAGLRVRVGIHTGEVVAGDGNLTGMAVHIGARVAALAQADEVLVSGTVRDLVIGSGIRFVPRGTHRLKGVPGTWEVAAVAG